jgi:leucyl-tRNA synthetase
MEPYNFRLSDAKWQNWWREHGVYTVTENPDRPKYYVLDMFPYPSGVGLHVGHPRGYVASDVFARQKRMSGYNVLHPMGYDSFGLPAEQYAIQTGNHPGPYTDKLIQSYQKQLEMIGFSYDWNRRVATHDAGYYKWTQWIFLKLYNHYYDTAANKAMPVEGLVAVFAENGNTAVSAATSCTEIFTADQWNAKTELEQQEILMHYRLAYEGYSEVNWCPELGTVLANDEVLTVNGKMVSERGSYPVERKKMRQWFMRITAYADRLIDGLDGIDWSESIKEIQRNWIGKSEGSEISFKLVIPVETGISLKESISVFTTRADTLFGVTYVVIAPEHELVQELLEYVVNRKEVEEYIAWVNARGEDDRISDKEKTGIVLEGITAINPANGESVLVWIADYVLASYGTGCVMAVPAHDERDFEFARKYDLPIRQVIAQETGGVVGDKPLCEYGILENSGEFTGKTSNEAKRLITEFVGGKIVTKYRMRDAIFARQRYWGEPIPLRYDASGVITALSESDLPLVLPELQSFEPATDGSSPLARSAAWLDAGYETNTMPGWAGSSWYWLRYMDPDNSDELVGRNRISYWRNVDMYVGGTEHATGHLLYSRFWNKFLCDIGTAMDEEPFKALRNQGMILAADGRKMSKRWGNTVTPDEMIERFGADAFRLYECFIGPFDASQPWIIDGLVGCARFLERVWKLQGKVVDGGVTDNTALKQLHKTIRKVGSDIAEFKFNTAASSLMELSNALGESGQIAQVDYVRFVQLLAPFAPHLCEEIYQRYAVGNGSVHRSSWPDYDPDMCIDDEVTIAFQVNGKLRGAVIVQNTSTEDDVITVVQSLESYSKWVVSDPKKIIYIPGKIVNVIV